MYSLYIDVYITLLSETKEWSALIQNLTLQGASGYLRGGQEWIPKQSWCFTNKEDRGKELWKTNQQHLSQQLLGPNVWVLPPAKSYPLTGRTFGKWWDSKSRVLLNTLIKEAPESSFTPFHYMTSQEKVLSVRNRHSPGAESSENRDRGRLAPTAMVVPMPHFTLLWLFLKMKFRITAKLGGSAEYGPSSWPLVFTGITWTQLSGASREQRCQARSQLPPHQWDEDSGEWPEPMPDEGKASCTALPWCPYQGDSLAECCMWMKEPFEKSLGYWVRPWEGLQ
jgi:hypothetical protein